MGISQASGDGQKSNWKYLLGTFLKHTLYIALLPRRLWKFTKKKVGWETISNKVEGGTNIKNANQQCARKGSNSHEHNLVVHVLREQAVKYMRILQSNHMNCSRVKTLPHSI